MSLSPEAHRPGMSRFSQFLLAKQLVVQEQLDQALQHQAVYGARLGTNLVELRMLTVERLAECLSEFHRIPLPPRTWLERPKRNAVERVTRPLVERIRFIPMRLENNNILHAAVLDPNDPATLDDLRFATGCKIHPYVLPEIWMHDWLFMLFKLPRGIRHIEANDNDRELEKPAQAYDFQAAQAAQAALAAKANRIMVPAVVGVAGPDEARPPGERKTMQGLDRAVVSPDARGAAAPPQRSGPPADVQARAIGERTTFHGGPRDRVAPPGQPARASDRSGPPLGAAERATAPGVDRQAVGPPRVSGQGPDRQASPAARAPGQAAERPPAGPAPRATMQGAERPAAGPVRVTMHGAERPGAPGPRVTMHGGERPASPGPRVTMHGAERQGAPGPRVTMHGGERQGTPAAPGPRMTTQGAERQGTPAAPGPRVTMHGGERQGAPGARMFEQGSEWPGTSAGRASVPGGERDAVNPARGSAQGSEHQASAAARSTGEREAMYPSRGPLDNERQAAPAARAAPQAAERQTRANDRPAAASSGEPPVAFVDKDVELFPTVSTGASVRPPPMSMSTLSDVGARASVPSVTGISSGGFAPPIAPIAPLSDLPNAWESEAPTSAAIAPLPEPVRPEAESSAAEQPPVAAAQPVPRATELSELEQSLRQVTDREQLIEISFAIASRFARVVALFMVHRGMVQGVRCLEDGESRVINGVLMPLEAASMLTHAANQFVPFRIDPRERPLDVRVQQLLTPRVVNEVGLFPVIVKSRAVNLLYASHGTEPLGTIAFGALSLLAEQMGAAYGQLILNRKGSG
jgi:hypothetical protein